MDATRNERSAAGIGRQPQRPSRPSGLLPASPHPIRRQGRGWSGAACGTDSCDPLNLGLPHDGEHVAHAGDERPGAIDGRDDLNPRPGWDQATRAGGESGSGQDRVVVVRHGSTVARVNTWCQYTATSSHAGSHGGSHSVTTGLAHRSACAIRCPVWCRVSAHSLPRETPSHARPKRRPQGGTPVSHAVTHIVSHRGSHTLPVPVPVYLYVTSTCCCPQPTPKRHLLDARAGRRLGIGEAR